MKKSILLTIVTLVLLSFAASFVYAGTPTAPPFACGKQPPALTDAQKQELAPLFTQMFEIKKQLIQKQVSFGNLTQEQADQHIARMQECVDKGMSPDMMGKGHGMMGKGHGMDKGHAPCQPPDQEKMNQ